MELKKTLVKNLIIPDPSNLSEKKSETSFFSRFPSKVLKSRNQTKLGTFDRARSVKPKREITVSPSRDKIIPESSSILESVYDGHVPFAFRRYHEDSFLSNKSDTFLMKHREALLYLLQIPKIAKNVDRTGLNKLRDLTVIPDKLSILVKSISGEKPKKYQENVFKSMSEEIKENFHEINELRESLSRVHKEKKELADMLISIETQQNLNVRIK